MNNFKKTKFVCNQETLMALSSYNKNNDSPNILFLHGAGQSDKTRVGYLMVNLQNAGHSSAVFDFSGHGESSGSIETSSLQKRTNEASTALLELLNNNNSVTVCGTSMGGHIAIKLLEKHDHIKNLILFCPAAYHKSAYTAPFNQEFSSIIRQEGSWKESDIFPLLEKFSGNLLVFIGANDQVIPKELIEMIDKCTSNTSKKEIVVIPDCDHMIHGYISQNPNLTNQVTSKIIQFL